VRPGRAADHSPNSSVAVMEEYSYNSTHPLGHTGPVTGPFNFTFILMNVNHYAKAHSPEYISIYNYKISLPVNESLREKPSQPSERR